MKLTQMIHSDCNLWLMYIKPKGHRSWAFYMLLVVASTSMKHRLINPKDDFVGVKGHTEECDTIESYTFVRQP